MNEIEALNIGHQFFKGLNHDIHSFDERDELGEIFDYTNFYSFPIVNKLGELYIGGSVLLLDKRTKFCLVIAGSPNFHDYHLRLFRIIVLNKLYDSKLELSEYQAKKENIAFNDFVHAIFLLLKSYPENFNTCFEFLEILILLENKSSLDKEIKNLSYKSLCSNEETLELFIHEYEFLKVNPQLNLKIEELEIILANKNQSIGSLRTKYKSILADREKEQVELQKLRNYAEKLDDLLVHCRVNSEDFERYLEALDLYDRKNYLESIGKYDQLFVDRGLEHLILNK